MKITSHYFFWDENRFFNIGTPQQPLEPKCSLIFILVFVSITDNNKNRLAPVSSVSALCLQGGSRPSWERKRLLLEEHRALPGCPHHQHPQNSQILMDSTSWGFQDFNFPCFIPTTPDFLFFFFSFFKNNQIGRKLAGAGGHWARGNPLKNPPNSHWGFRSWLLRCGVRSGFGEISQLTLELFFQITGEEVRMGPPITMDEWRSQCFPHPSSSSEI